mgnify:CR=1 FL=1
MSDPVDLTDAGRKRLDDALNGILLVYGLKNAYLTEMLADFACDFAEDMRAEQREAMNKKDALIGKLSRAVAGTNDLEARVAILIALLERAMTAEDPSEWLSDAQEYLAAIRAQGTK